MTGLKWVKGPAAFRGAGYYHSTYYPESGPGSASYHRTNERFKLDCYYAGPVVIAKPDPEASAPATVIPVLDGPPTHEGDYIVWDAAIPNYLSVVHYKPGAVVPRGLHFAGPFFVSHIPRAAASS